jgi:hypothetical protein
VQSSGIDCMWWQRPSCMRQPLQACLVVGWVSAIAGTQGGAASLAGVCPAQQAAQALPGPGVRVPVQSSFCS